MSNGDPAKNGPKAARPIDPPSIPPRGWGGRPSGIDEEDEPTQNYLDPLSDSPVALLEEEPPPDPAALAQQLAEQAKQRMIAGAPPEEPRQEPRMTQEDPRELARRLADEAKRRLQSTPPPPVPPPVDPQIFGADDDDDVGGFVPPDEEEPNITMAPTRPLGERATGGRAMTALEALAAAREAERNRPSEPYASTPSSSERWSAEPRSASEPRSRSEAPSGPVPVTRAVSVLSEVFGAVAESPASVRNPDVFRALWRAHRTRAVHEGDLGLVMTASVLLDAIDRVPAGYLVSARVSIGGQVWAAWVDVERGSLLGLARPAEVYLTS